MSPIVTALVPGLWHKRIDKGYGHVERPAACRHRDAPIFVTTPVRSVRRRGSSRFLTVLDVDVLIAWADNRDRAAVDRNSVGRAWRGNLSPAVVRPRNRPTDRKAHY